MKIGLNNPDDNDRSAFDAANNRVVAQADGTYLFSATLLCKILATTLWLRPRALVSQTPPTAD